MKILHITTVRSGRTATDLKALLTRRGEEYKIAFSVPDAKPLNGDIQIGSLLDHKVHAFLSRLFGLQGYFSYYNYINLPLLFNYIAKEKDGGNPRNSNVGLPFFAVIRMDFLEDTFYTLALNPI